MYERALSAPILYSFAYAQFFMGSPLLSQCNLNSYNENNHHSSKISIRYTHQNLFCNNNKKNILQENYLIYISNYQKLNFNSYQQMLDIIHNLELQSYCK